MGVVKMGNEMDRVKMANESLTQVKAKLEDGLKSFKTEIDALKKRFADLDRDNRKVVHEREELARAYKKSDEEKAKALNQVQLLEKELAKLKAEFEKTFGGARSEYEANKAAKSYHNFRLETRPVRAGENFHSFTVEDWR